MDDQIPISVAIDIFSRNGINSQSEVETYTADSGFTSITHRINDSTEILVATDNKGMFSGATFKLKWIYRKNGDPYKFVQTIASETYEFRGAPGKEYTELVYTYVVQKDGPEYRKSRFVWNGDKYKFRELLEVNGKPNKIPTLLLTKTDFYFVPEEFEDQSPGDPDFSLDSLLYMSIGLKGFSYDCSMIRYHRADQTYTTYIFTKTDSLIQIINANIVLDSTLSNGKSDFRIIYESRADSIINCCEFYKWNETSYELKKMN